MSQRNPMNDRYQQDEEQHVGHTRKSAASAKPKNKAAASVTVKKAAKTPEQKKAAQKRARQEQKAEQRRLDRLYYKPDTERYKKLRTGWWVCLVGAIACTAVSWFARDMGMTVSTVFMVLAYALIIAAFYIDFSKIRKERQAYQARMIALEEKQKKEEKAAARAARSSAKKKGSGKNASRNPKTQAKAAAEHAAEKEAEESSEKDAAPAKPEKKGFFGRKKAKDENAAASSAEAAAEEGSDAAAAKPAE